MKSAIPKWLKDMAEARMKIAAEQHRVHVYHMKSAEHRSTDVVTARWRVIHYLSTHFWQSQWNPLEFSENRRSGYVRLTPGTIGLLIGMTRPAVAYALKHMNQKGGRRNG